MFRVYLVRVSLLLLIAPVLALAAACASKGGPATGDQSTQRVVPMCGDRAGILLSPLGSIFMSGSFPAQVSGKDGGSFSGTLKVTNTGTTVSGVTSPEPDVFVIQAGKVVSTPLPKDLIGTPFNLDSGTTRTFTARGAIQQCATSSPSGTGKVLPPGNYDVAAVLVVNQDKGSAIVITGGPWPIELT